MRIKPWTSRSIVRCATTWVTTTARKNNVVASILSYSRKKKYFIRKNSREIKFQASNQLSGNISSLVEKKVCFLCQATFIIQGKPADSLLCSLRAFLMSQPMALSFSTSTKSPRSSDKYSFIMETLTAFFGLVWEKLRKEYMCALSQGFQFKLDLGLVLHVLDHWSIPL